MNNANNMSLMKGRIMEGDQTLNKMKDEVEILKAENASNIKKLENKDILISKFKSKP